MGVAILTLALPWPAEGAFPGRNGKLAFGLTTTADRPFNTDIWTVQPPDSTFERLTSDPGMEGWPEWSSNGRWIAFSRTSVVCCRGAGDSIWVARPDGTHQRRVTDGPGDTSPSWSPDGRRIVFASARNDPAPQTSEDYDLFVINTDGSGLRLLVAHPGRTEEDPAWSPDGSAIAFTARCVPPCPPGRPSGIRTISPDGTEETAVTPTEHFARSPDWSPDGSRIAYTTGDRNLTVRPDGSDRTPLPASHQQTDPAWSPDGTKIAFSGMFVGYMNLDGTGYVPLAGWVAGGPSWQPLGPRRQDYKNGPAFCGAERAFLGEDEFEAQYLNFGGCVSAK